MSNMSIRTTGVMGGNSKQSKQGLITVYNGNAEMLTIDNYVGRGEAYQQRPEPVITIFDGLNPPNEVMMFRGTHSQLVDLLSKAQ